MAIQNFLSGGYYGKLGATVGQRWKNKRTIRTYVVPSNPRTPTQQANRSRFADAVTFAQMGMQMNYYCTLFDNPDFTRWNYRMKVARELKSAGLSGLDLIPLYPISFNPPVLIPEIVKGTVTGQKHISFAVPALTLNNDRVLSLMFALYNEQDIFLGYKLYLGYYYASNPGYVEVDVDNVAEINTHCFVRIISNDDEDSTTDLIGSSRLAVGSSEPEVRDFNTAIREVQKTTAGIKVVFEEIWKGAPTVNNITITANFVSNGTTATATATSATLENENGCCSILIPFVTSDNQHLPAFPDSSNFVVTSVDYEGSTWQYTKTDATILYSDTDLSRTIDASPAWDASSIGDITFTVPFGGTVATSVKNFNMVCSGRIAFRTAESQSFNVVGNGTNLVFTCTGSRKDYPMMISGDQISITAQSFVCNGVTYNLPAQDVALRNAITTSYFLEELSWAFLRNGGGSTGTPLQSLSMSSFITGVSHASVVKSNVPTFTYVEVVPDEYDCIPDTSTYSLTPSGTVLYIDLMDDYSESEHNDQVQNSNIVYSSNMPSMVVDNITYIFHETWIYSNLPETIAGWKV